MKILSALQTIQHPLFLRHNLQVQIKRDDLIHPVISGNKWRKLKCNLAYAKQEQFKGIVSFGGAYSNHIHALAYACQQEGLASIGIIRGEAHYQQNSTLSQAKTWGMTLNFVDRATYRLREKHHYLQSLREQYECFHIVPEGGSNQLALKGVGEIINELNNQTDYDTLLTPVGSSGTLTGLIKADNNQHNLLGVSVLKNAEYLNDSIKELLLDSSAKHFNNWKLLTDFHRGGYAKFSKQDEQRILTFSEQTGILFEPIYSGKMLLAFLDLVELGYFPAKHKIVLLHTGGLQGLLGLAEQSKLQLDGWPMANNF